MSSFAAVLEAVQVAQAIFKNRLARLVEEEGGLSENQYARYLSMQYYLTKGVQKHFFQAAAHQELANRKALREFLLRFGDEEEPHYLIAAKDLENMKRVPMVEPLDVKLWWTYFDAQIATRPFLRLGATCVLENLSAGAGDLVNKIFSDAKYLSPRNFRFFTIHKHEGALNHGDQILDALKNANLEVKHFNDLIEGTQTGIYLYMRMLEWVLDESATGAVRLVS